MQYSKYEVLLQIKLLKVPQLFTLFEIFQGYLSAKSAGYKGNLFVLMQNMLHSFMATYINWAKSLVTLLSNHWHEAKITPTTFTEEEQENHTDTRLTGHSQENPHSTVFSSFSHDFEKAHPRVQKGNWGTRH